MMKKRGRRILPLLLLVLVLVFGCCGCQSEVQDARQAVDDGMKQLQEGDLAEAADYFKGLDDIDKVLGTYESYGVDLEQLTGAMFGQMNYEITDAEKMKDNTVRVKVKITNKDMNKAAGPKRFKRMQRIRTVPCTRRIRSPASRAFTRCCLRS